MLGAVVTRNLRRAGFVGEVMLVDPHRSAIDGHTIHPTVASLPQAPDLAVIAVEGETVPVSSASSAVAERGPPS